MVRKKSSIDGCCAPAAAIARTQRTASQRNRIIWRVPFSVERPDYTWKPTIRRGLELVAAGEAYRGLRRLKGKVSLSIDLDTLRDDEK